VPLGTRLVNGTAEFNQMEALGLQASTPLQFPCLLERRAANFYTLNRLLSVQDTAFVLVAGGLGERLGYKVRL